jgi:mono/diheme cytochrome c family protein
MKNHSAVAGIALSIVAGAAILLVANAPGKDAPAGSAAQIERGRYLVAYGGCNDCHSPKIVTDEGVQVDPARMLSGYPADRPLPDYDPKAVGPWVLFTDDLTACVAPWGTVCAANITPDEQTGIGLWTAEHFVGAMRTGKHMGTGRPIELPMPWFNLAGLTDEDLTAIFAYLKSIPPVKNPVPAPMPPRKG